VDDDWEDEKTGVDIARVDNNWENSGGWTLLEWIKEIIWAAA